MRWTHAYLLSPMQFAFCNEAYVDWPFERVCGDLAACGYDGVEIAPFTLDEDPRRIDERRAAEDRRNRPAGGNRSGRPALAAGQARRFSSHHAGRRPCESGTVEFLRHLARICAAMGGRVMVFGSPKQRSILPGEKSDDVFARAADAFRAVCEIAGPLGVTLAIEPLSPVETDFLNTAAETVRLIDAVDHPACRLHLDVKAMSSEAGSDRQDHSRPSPIPRPFSRERSQSSRPRLGRSRFRADRQSLEDHRLRRLRFGRSLRLHARRSDHRPHEHRVS